MKSYIFIWTFSYIFIVPLTSGNTWPINYIYKKSECIDSNGTITKVDVKYENNNIIINTSKTVYCTIYFDKDTTKPTITSFYIKNTNPQPKYSNNTSRQENATLTWNDEDVVSYCIIPTNNVTSCDSNNNWKGANSKTGTLQLTLTEGSNTYYAFLKDIAGNTSALENGLSNSSDTIVLDTKAPTIETQTKATTIGETTATITIVASDANSDLEVSGVKQYCYSMKDTNTVSDFKCETYKASGENTFTIDKDASDAALNAGTTYTYYVYATDNAGNGNPTTKTTLDFTTKQTAGGKVIEQAGSQIQSEPVAGDTLRRFQGTPDTVLNNYICFGTSDLNTCTSKQGTYMYRIMGVDVNTNQLKIIKKEALDTAYYWNNTTGSAYTWNNSMIYKQLNGISTGDDENYPSNIFLTNTTYALNTTIPNTSTKWSDAIETHRWSYGDVPNNSSSGANSNTIASTVLTNEHTAWSSSVWSDGKSTHGTVDAKIGLMYLSDYYLAVSNDSNCYSNYSKCKASWIFIGNNDTDVRNGEYEWTMSRINDRYLWVVYNLGQVKNDGLHSMKHVVRPVFYLISNIKLDGDGSIGNPYRIIGITS